MCSFYHAFHLWSKETSALKTSEACSKTGDRPSQRGRLEILDETSEVLRVGFNPRGDTLLFDFLRVSDYQKPRRS